MVSSLLVIIEGTVPADLVKKELAHLIPVKWDWVVQEHGTNTYIVPFPCQVELQRIVSIKRHRTDNNEGVMSFQEWNHEIKPKTRLQKVWVHVYGVPYEIRSFPTFEGSGFNPRCNTKGGHAIHEKDWCAQIVGGSTGCKQHS